jgi:hypothetical protein
MHVVEVPQKSNKKNIEVPFGSLTINDNRFSLGDQLKNSDQNINYANVSRMSVRREKNVKEKLKLNDFLKNILSTIFVDYNAPKLKFNQFPASVNVDSKLLHVHYLF